MAISSSSPGSWRGASRPGPAFDRRLHRPSQDLLGRPHGGDENRLLKHLRDELKAQDLGLVNVMKPAAAGATVGWISFNPQLRQIVDEEMEAVFMGKKSAKSALDAAVARGQAVYKPLPTVASTGKARRK